MFLFFMLLLSGLELIRAQAGNDNLGLLYEGKSLEVATLIQSERVSLEFIINATEVEMRESFIKIKNAGEGWYKLGFLQGNTLKQELLHGLDSGVIDVKNAWNHASHLYSFLRPDNIAQNESSCVFQVYVISRQTLLQGAIMVESQFDKIKADWTEEQILNDLGKLAILYQFVTTFNSQMSFWRASFSQTVTEFDTLQNGIFPQSLLGQVELATCLPTAKNEIVKVQGCKAGKDRLICEIEFNYAKGTANYTEMIPINYEGLELDGNEQGWIYAKDSQTQSLALLNCSNSEFNNPETPLCMKVESQEKCLKGLLLNDLDFVVENCNFHLSKQAIAKRLPDNGILVMRSDAKVSVNGKIIFKPAPFIVYSNSEVAVAVGEDEIVFPNRVQFKNPRIVTSKIAKTLIESLKSKAKWAEFWAKFIPEDYLIYFALGLQVLVFLPISLCSLCCGNCKRDRKNKQVDKMLKGEAKAKKRKNFAENRALLAGPVTMPIILQTPRERNTSPYRRTMM
jgi:hypothetical protein